MTYWFKPLQFPPAVLSVVLYSKSSVFHLFLSLSHFPPFSPFHLLPVADRSSSLGVVEHNPQCMNPPAQQILLGSFDIRCYPYFCESLCHLWSGLQMKLTSNFYYSRNSEVIVQTTNHWSWQDGAPRGVQGSTALIVIFSPFYWQWERSPKPFTNHPSYIFFQKLRPYNFHFLWQSFLTFEIMLPLWMKIVAQFLADSLIVTNHE